MAILRTLGDKRPFFGADYRRPVVAHCLAPGAWVPAMAMQHNFNTHPVKKPIGDAPKRNCCRQSRALTIFTVISFITFFKILLGIGFLKPSARRLQDLELFYIAADHLDKLRSMNVGPCPPNPLPLSDRDDRNPIGFAEYPVDLLFTAPACLNTNSSVEEPLSLDQPGPKIAGQVTYSTAKLLRNFGGRRLQLEQEQGK
jgi:hypothetical protein